MHKISILVIEDNPGYATLVKLALRPLGLEEAVIHLETGEDGLIYLKHFRPRPEFIILDYNMPALNGLETLKAIRTDERLMDSKVVLFTTMELNEIKFKEYRPNKHIVKPMLFDDYCKILRDLCEEWLKL